MADSFKKLTANDVAYTKSLVHETVRIDGDIVWSSFPTYPANSNKKDYSHGMFQSVFDYDFTNSSANQIFDLTIGVHEDSTVFDGGYVEANDEYHDKKIHLYNTLAQQLCGFATDGSVLQFDRDGNFSGGGEKYTEIIAFLFTRLLHKDGIKIGSFSLSLALSPTGYGDERLPTDPFNWDGANPTDSVLVISDVGADTNYRTNSPAGRYAILYASQPSGAGNTILEPTLLDIDNKVSVGLIFYDAGIVVLTPWIFKKYDGVGTAATDGFLNDDNAESDTLMLFNSTDGGDYDEENDPPTVVNPTHDTTEGYYMINELLAGQEDGAGSGTDVDIPISDCCDAIRQRIDEIEFLNTTELNSTVYFCRANHNDFNYSSNPTYCDGSRIVVKSVSSDAPVSFITTIGLYSSDNELLAVAKLSEPFKKSSDNELNLRVRLDY